MTVARACVAVLAVFAFLAASTGVAQADPARPTNYESTVEGVSPEVGGLTAEMIGGDAFLLLEAPPGAVVEVPGYSGEPYLRIEADGSVSLNRSSPAYWINEDRFAQVEIPPGVGPEAPPRWERAGSDGRWAWHDHRTHWMSPQPPPGIVGDRPQQVFEWVVPVRVDGLPVEVTGSVTWHPPVSPLPWLGIAAVAAGVTFAAGSSRGAIALVTGGAAAAAVSVVQALESPPGAGSDTVALAAAVVAAGCGILASTTVERRPSLSIMLGVLGAVLLAVWSLQRISGLWLPVLPTSLPTWAERSMVAIALGSAVGAGAVAARHLLRGAPVSR